MIYTLILIQLLYNKCFYWVLFTVSFSWHVVTKGSTLNEPQASFSTIKSYPRVSEIFFTYTVIRFDFNLPHIKQEQFDFTSDKWSQYLIAIDIVDLNYWVHFMPFSSFM